MINPNIKFSLANMVWLCFLKNIVKNPNIVIGDYTYYDDSENIENFNKVELGNLIRAANKICGEEKPQLDCTSFRKKSDSSRKSPARDFEGKFESDISA